MTMSAPAPTTIDEIVDGLKDHVWVLLRAGHVTAAMALLADSIEDYLRIVAEVEAIGSDDGRHSIPAPEEEPPAADEEPEPTEPVTVEVVEITALPTPGDPMAVRVMVEDGATWEIPLQTSSTGKAVMLRERS